MVEKIKLALERAYQEREGASNNIASRRSQTSVAINPGPASASVEYLSQNELANTKYSIVDIERLRDHRIVTYDDQNENIESFRRLRSQVLHYVDTAGISTIGITSPSSQEGKTLAAVNLAISLVRNSDTNVVLVDGDISNPSIHDVFGLDVQFGMVDILNSSVGITDVIQRVNIPNLWIVPGRQDTISLSNQANSNRVDELVNDFSLGAKTIVIVDLPPILGKDDTLVFTSSLDGVLLVVNEGETKSDEVVRAAGLLKQCNVIGTILNNSSQQISGV